MRRAMLSCPVGLALLEGFLGASGCSSPGWCSPRGPVAPGCDLPPEISVLVSPTNATIDVGMTIQMVNTIRINPPSTNYTVSWSSSDTTKAGVNVSGLVTGKALSPGVAICANLNAMGYSTQACA